MHPGLVQLLRTHTQVDPSRLDALAEPVGPAADRTSSVVGVPVIGLETGHGDSAEAITLGIGSALATGPPAGPGFPPVRADEQPRADLTLTPVVGDRDPRTAVRSEVDHLGRTPDGRALGLGPRPRDLLKPRMGEAGGVQLIAPARGPRVPLHQFLVLVGGEGIDVHTVRLHEQVFDPESPRLHAAPVVEALTTDAVAEPGLLLGQENIHPGASQRARENGAGDPTTGYDDIEGLRSGHGSLPSIEEFLRRS